MVELEPAVDISHASDLNTRQILIILKKASRSAPAMILINIFTKYMKKIRKTTESLKHEISPFDEQVDLSLE